MTTLNGKRTHWMDKALEDQPAERKARVLEIILKYDIDPEDEFFVLFVAIGQLLALIEESPESWQTLFADFEAALEAWGNNHLKSLEVLGQNANLALKHSQGLKKLSTILVTYGKISRQHEETIKSLVHTSNEWNKKHSDTLTQCKNTLEKLHKENLIIVKDQTNLYRSLSEALSQRKTETSRDKSDKILLFLTVLSFIGTCCLGYGWWQQNSLLHAIEQKNQWLWTTQLKQDCVSGARAATSVECRSLR